MTFWGAKVLQYRSVEIAKNYNVPLYVGSAYKTENGTTVGDLNFKEDSDVFAINSHENILRIVCPFDTISNAIDWLRQFLLTQNIPFPQLLHSERSIDGVDIFITAPVENISSIASEMRLQSFFQEVVCSVTATCRGTLDPELMEKVLLALEDNKIKIMYMIISNISLTVFLRPNYRKQAIELLHRIVKHTNVL
jgi:aspartate kinase